MGSKVNESFARLLHSPDEAEEAIQQSIQAALSQHGKAGRAMPIWRGEQIVWVVPDKNGDLPDAK